MKILVNNDMISMLLNMHYKAAFKQRHPAQYFYCSGPPVRSMCSTFSHCRLTETLHRKTGVVNGYALHFSVFGGKRQ